nr:TolC family protein [Sphingomicrobium nitratireducens]
MDEAVAFALDRSFGVQRAERNVQIADHQVDSARAQKRIKFDSHLRAGQSANYSEFTGNAFKFSNAKPDFSATMGAVASIPIDLWGVAGRQIRQAQYSRDRVSLAFDQAFLGTALEVRGNYVFALQSKERADANRASQQEIEQLMARLPPAQDDLITYLDSERGLAVQQLDSSVTQEELARAQLAQSLRLPSGLTLTLSDQLTPLAATMAAEQLFATASRHRSDLLQAEINLDQAMLRREQAKDGRRPNLGVDAFADQGVTGRTPLFGDLDSGRSLGVGVAARLVVPLLHRDGGVLRNQRAIADLQADQALSDHAEALERATNEIERLLITRTRLAARMEKLPDIARAEATLADAEGRLLSAPPRDAPAMLAQVTIARDNLRSARLARSSTLGEQANNLIALSRAVGTDLFVLGIP